MAEVKNTFIQSKMNRDLDGRILPNGQYREGVNIQISRSEGDDVGALENVLGTGLLTSFGLDNCAYEIIGHTVDLANDLVYVFITDYSDSSNNKLDNNITGQTAAFGINDKNCFIGVYNDRTKNGTLIVGGDFLNFSKTHPITGVNLIEDLLFWTDNRNQPRKVNVKTVAPGSGNEFKLGIQDGYYTNEDTVSVAKYYPFECISLLENNGGSSQWVSTMTNKTEEWLPPYCIAAVQTGVTGFSIVLDGNYNIKLNSAISGVNIASNPSGSLAIVTNSLIDTPLPNQTTITLDSSQTVAAEDLIYFQAPNPEYDAVWPGDETFLSDKFVRFSYRFEFDDGEYSLMAPFTQACFVPKQDGYFIGNDVENLNPPMNTVDAVAPFTGIPWNVSSSLIGDEGKAYASSIVEFFENKIQDIGLHIPAPYKNNIQSTFDNIQDEFKIKNIEIIYKESDSTNAYVLDTIPADKFTLETSSFYSYDYQSRKPWKTLPGNEITRVYDKVPIRALAQESSGNRIIYGNYIDKHTSPDSLSYVVGISEKPPLPNPGDAAFGDKDYYIRKEYQNHTVKQNRTYQVGIVLSDRYGRQSDVILSDVYDQAIQGYGSTIYHPYESTQATLIDSTDTWAGDMINMVFHQGIPNTISPSKKGYPGLYRNNDKSFVGFRAGIGTSSNWGAGAGCCYEVDIVASNLAMSTARIRFCTNASGGIDVNTVEVISSSHDWNEGVEIATMTPVVYPACSPAPLPTNHVQSGFKAKTLVNQNTLGWYSWKIVVKQTEQDYYNCYLPGILAGYPKDLLSNGEFNAVLFPKGDVNKVSHIVLVNDNINKIPRDLSEIGPTQKIFGSSVKLFGRVENHKYNDSGWFTYNRQFDPETLPDTVVNIGSITDLNLGAKLQAGDDNKLVAPFSYPDKTSILMPVNFFNGVSNPLVAQLSTKAQIGWVANDTGVQDTTLGMIPYLAIYETAPIESDLDIYWETSTSGLISELNFNVATVDNTGPCDMTDPSIDWVEDMAPGTIISDDFSAVSCIGVDLSDPAYQTTIDLISVINDNGNSRIGDIELFKYAGRNEYRLQLSNNNWQNFLAWNNENDRTWHFTFQVNSPATTSPPIVQAISFQTTFTTKVQNATPNQTGMFKLTAGNNARTDLKSAVFNQQGQYLNLARYTSYADPDYIIVGDWQNNSPYSGDSDNSYWQTFGRNYVDGLDCEYFRHADGNLGYGKNEVGGMDYRPNKMEIWGDSPNVFPALTIADATATLLGAGLCRCSFPSKYITTAGTCCSSVGHKRDYKDFLNSKITMIKKPGIVGVDTWDGVFESWNGAYGSILPYPSTPNPNRSQEIEYSIARVYQVSAFFPFQTDISDYYDCNDCGWSGCVSTSTNGSLAKYNIAECVFSTDASGNPIPLLKGLPYMGAGEIQVTWDGWTATSAHAPPGPIYYDFKDPSNNIIDPCVVGSGGEATVLQQYNIGNSHYWKDLSDEINGGTTEGLSLKKIWTPGTGIHQMPNSTGKTGFWYINDVQTTSQNWKHHIDLKLGIQQANKNDYAANFWMKDGGTSDGNYQTPATATLMTDKQRPIPPGRYVVTVRATDRSVGGPAGKGSYFEWDVPIIVNGPFPEQVGTWVWYKSTIIVPGWPNGFIEDHATWQHGPNYSGNNYNPPSSFGPGPFVGTWSNDPYPFPY